MKPTRTLEERFWSKIQKSAVGGCWMWTGAKDRHGYGRVTILAHRLGWLLLRGAVPGGLNLLHQCDTPACVNPDHLIPGTQAENMADMIAKGRHRPGRGERHARSKVSDADVDRIRILARAGMSKSEIARQYGLTPTGVRYIVNGRRRLGR